MSSDNTSEREVQQAGAGVQGRGQLGDGLLDYLRCHAPIVPWHEKPPAYRRRLEALVRGAMTKVWTDPDY